MAQTRIGPQRTYNPRASASPYDASVRPAIWTQMRLKPPVAAETFHPTSSSLANAFTLESPQRDPATYWSSTHGYGVNVYSYKQETPLANALDPVLVHRAFRAGTRAPSAGPAAASPYPPGGASFRQEGHLPVEFTPAQTIMSAFPPTPGYTNGSSHEGGSSYDGPQTPPDEAIGYMDPNRYTQQIQPCAMPVAEHSLPYHAMNPGVSAETPEQYKSKFHPVSIVGTPATEMEVGSSPLSVPETATGTPGKTPRSRGVIKSTKSSQERWEAFRQQHKPVIGVPFENADFGIVLPKPKTNGNYPAKIHEHRDFENTLSPDVKFDIANMRRGVEWSKLRRSQRHGEDPLLQYEVFGNGKERRFRCPLCGQVLKSVRGLSHHVESIKHLNIRTLLPTIDYSGKKAWKLLKKRSPQNPEERGEGPPSCGVESQDNGREEEMVK